MEIKTQNLTEAWLRVIRQFQDGGGVIVNRFRGDIFLNLFDLLLLSETQYTVGTGGPLPDLVLEDIGYTPSKVDHLLKSYLDMGEVKRWYKQIRETEAQYGQCDSDVLLQTIRESRHSNGPCLLGFSYRSRGGPCLTVYSRSVDFPDKAMADSLLIDALAELIAGGPCKVRWYIAGARIRSRVANLFTAWSILNAEQTPVYSDPDFQRHVQAGWRKFIVEGRAVSFRKLESIQELGRQALGLTPRAKTETTSLDFLRRLKEAIR